MSIMDGYSADFVWSELARMDPNSPAMMEEVDSIEASFSELFGSAAKTRSSKEAQQSGNLVICGQSPVRRRSGAAAAAAAAADLGMRRYRSFLLIDHNQQLMVSSAEQFIEHLNVDRDAKVKVVSIFGNTGDGKSHTLNHTFFGGRPIFKTSSEQGACTLGVWAAYDDELKIICLDTEGLQGMSLHENKTTRLLLKVLAISDVVIYRTVAEKLQQEMYDFLGAASKAYVHHFQDARTKGDESEEKKLGPSVIIFHETRHIDPLQNTPDKFAETMISHQFRNKKQNIEAFSSIEYVGIQTHHRYTDFTSLRTEVQKQLDNTELRLARSPAVVYDRLKIINDAFSGELEIVNYARSPNQYFICNAECKSCHQRCELQGGHLMDGKDHSNHNNCRFQLQFDNKVKICQKCYLKGHTAYVKISQVTQEDGWFNLSKLVYPGVKVDCPNCGEIFKSWPSLIPNTDPEIGTIRIDIIHVWSLPENHCETSHTGQRLVDTVLNLSSTIESYTSAPVIRNWLFNQCNPSYWRPDSELIRCHKCKTLFSSLVTKHHCRACGEGFCDACSSNTRPVPARNWPDPVRVCDDCYELNDEDIGAAAEAAPVADVGPRWFTEHVFYGLGAVGSLINYSKSLIKDTARPSYWVPDSELTNCCVCKKEFSPQLPYHHCRDCGRGVCDNCSKTRKPVPRRNWPDPVRVCDACIPN